jgi:hypothetical protein
VQFPWAIWVEWPGRADWTTREGAVRLVESVRLVNVAFPGVLDKFRVRLEDQWWEADTPGVVDRVAGALVGRQVPVDGDMFHDVHALLQPTGPAGASIECDQSGTDPVRSQGMLRLRFGKPSHELLTKNPMVAAGLIAELCRVWGARNGWLDMVHVRQEWNYWQQNCPLFGWATWLHPRYATVDAGGLDVDASGTPDGGRLLVLRVDPAEMADRRRNVGRDVIRALIARTVLADGQRLLDVFPEAGPAPTGAE